MKASKNKIYWVKRHTCESSRKNSGGVTTKSPRSLPEEWDEEKFFSRASLARTDSLFPKLAKVSLLAGLILSDSLSLRFPASRGLSRRGKNEGKEVTALQFCPLADGSFCKAKRKQSLISC